MWKYYIKVLSRAWKNTLSSLGFPHQQHLSLTLASFLAALAIVYVIGGEEQMSEELRWGLAVLIAGGVVFVPMFLLKLVTAPAQIQEDMTKVLNCLDDKLKQFETPGIDLVFDEKFPACKHEDVRSEGTRTYYRVGVRSLSMKTIRNVEVMLNNFSPQGAQFLPVPLSPMNSAKGSSSTFDVDPAETPTRYVDVISWIPGEEFVIYYHSNVSDIGQIRPNTIPMGNYTFTLLAHGEDIPSCERKFVARINEQGELVFCSFGSELEVDLVDKLHLNNGESGKSMIE